MWVKNYKNLVGPHLIFNEVIFRLLYHFKDKAIKGKNYLIEHFNTATNFLLPIIQIKKIKPLQIYKL